MRLATAFPTALTDCYYSFVMLVRDRIAARVGAAVEAAQRDGILPSAAVTGPLVERPSKPEHGDFASSVPLRLARAARMQPLEIAEHLVALVSSDEAIERVWAAPPGFLNFKLSDDWVRAQVEAVRSAGASYGNVDVGQARPVQVEFVSANPTGPLHVGTARGAVLGSSLANVLEAAGYRVNREYYVNDAGLQMRLFFDSVFARYAQALGRTGEEVPEGGYQGAYLAELGVELAQELGERHMSGDREAAIHELGELGLQRMLVNIRADLELIGVTFDTWFSERDLFANKQYDTTMDLLRERGYTAERDGALWFMSTALGEDKDNVLVRGTGQPTYFASDIAYHYDKFVGRGFDRVIDIWGADHQGHVPRMKVVMGALGIEPERLTILISQLVTLKRGNETVRASKRTGQLISIRELVSEVGPDACRYFFLARAADSQMEFDMELAKRESPDNPVYYVQYAHARIAGIIRQAQERSLSWDDGDVSLLRHEAELALVRKIVQLPELIDSIATTLAPHALPHYATELATAFHLFYDNCRVLSQDDADLPLSKARLKLAEASKLVLARCLGLMGMTTPESM